ncbi:hypothetical protein JCM17960_01760 [Magnetospira thiophila]
MPLAWALLAGLGLATGSVALGITVFPFHLLIHFPLQYAALCIPLALLFALRRRKRWAMLTLLVGLVDLGLALPLLSSAEASHAPAARINLLSFNLHPETRHGEQTAQWIVDSEAEAVLLQEVTPLHLPLLARLRESYPYQMVHPHPTFWGLALLSRTPISDGQLIQKDAESFRLLKGTIRLANGRSVTLATTHFMPPLWPAASDLQRTQADLLRGVLADLSGPLLLGGDFNTTPWSPLYRRLVEENRLTSRGRAWWTWPTWFPGLGIPIDHLFGRDGARIVQATAGPDLGSDHRPLQVIVNLTE